jgi:hypothetical protein
MKAGTKELISLSCTLFGRLFLIITYLGLYQRILFRNNFFIGILCGFLLSSLLIAIAAIFHKHKSGRLQLFLDLHLSSLHLSFAFEGWALLLRFTNKQSIVYQSPEKAYLALLVFAGLFLVFHALFTKSLYIILLMS